MMCEKRFTPFKLNLATTMFWFLLCHFVTATPFIRLNRSKYEHAPRNKLERNNTQTQRPPFPLLRSVKACASNGIFEPKQTEMYRRS